MRHLFLLLLSLTVFVSCQDDDDAQRTDIRIRVENRTDTDLQNVIIQPNFNISLSYGTISPGGLTSYQYAESGDHCSFGYSMITGSNDSLNQLPPLCNLAAPLANGDYRLVLDSIIVGQQRIYFVVQRFERE